MVNKQLLLIVAVLIVLYFISKSNDTWTEYHVPGANLRGWRNDRTGEIRSDV